MARRQRQGVRSHRLPGELPGGSLRNACPAGTQEGRACEDAPDRLAQIRGRGTRSARKINKEARAKGNKVQPQTLIAAGFVLLVTSLDREEFPADTVLKLYRMRWRIELAFKRLKSLIGLRSPPAKDPRIARPWILAHFLIALVTEPLSQELGVSPP
ncbi:transposase [Mesorhizobium sp. LNJC395A00]|uniref:transposase n=1 Tax=Mesorhizobium sp. LNJC395A00 TaxID=1287275 RepID=UPI000A00122E|nr:transposase [Mesorhizobium sp. LNJC395A00]